MEPQNSSTNSSSFRQHPLIPTSFSTNASSFPIQFTTGLNAAATSSSNGNVGSPLFMQTLQQLSGLSSGLLPAAASNPPSFPTMGNQFPAADLSNWSSQSAWFDQAKMAAMLPVYLQTAVTKSNDQNFQFQHDVSSIMEQNFKNQAVAAVAAAAVSNFQTSAANQNYNNQAINAHAHQKNLRMHTQAAAPVATNVFPNNNNNKNNNIIHNNNIVTHQRAMSRQASEQQLPVHQIGALTQQQQQAQKFQQPHLHHPTHASRTSSTSGTPLGLAQSPITSGPPSAGANTNMHGSPLSSRLIHSHASYPSSSSSYPPSNEAMVESPLSAYSGITHQMNQHHQQQREMNANSNASPYNYHSAYIQQQNHHKHSNPPSPHIVMNNNSKQIKSLASPLSAEKQNSISSLDRMESHKISCMPSTSSQIIQQNCTPNQQHLSNIQQIQQPTFSKHQYNPNVQHENDRNEYQQKHHAIMPVFPSTSAIAHEVEGGLVDNVDDFSTMLDLRDFEEFLNDKDAVAAALRADPTVLFNETVDDSSVNAKVNTITTTPITSQTTHTTATTFASSSNEKSATESRKNALNISVPITSTSLITSAKMRERIHERRAEELANADKELDRLVSLVAKQNDAKSRQKSNNFSMLKLDLLNSLKPKNLPVNTAASPSDSMLNPVQFTPPDSPTNFDAPTTNTEAKNQLATNLLGSRLSSLKNDLATKSTITKPVLNSPVAVQIDSNAKNCIETALASKQVSSAAENSLQRQKSAQNFLCDTKQREPNAISAKTLRSTPTQPLMFIPKMENLKSSPLKVLAASRTPKGDTRIKYNRIPIYKQRQLQNSSTFSSRILSESTAGKEASTSNVFASKFLLKNDSKNDEKSDAYNFTDDEEQEECSAMPKSLTVAATTSTNNSGGSVRTRNIKNSELSAHNPPENALNSSHRTRKRHNTLADDRNNAYVSVAPAGALINNLHNKSSQKLQPCQSLLDMLRQRREQNNGYLKAIDCSTLQRDDDSNEDIKSDAAFTPDAWEQDERVGSIDSRRRPTMTCTFKMENSIAAETSSNNIQLNSESDCKPLPKLVIKLVKPEPPEFAETSEISERVNLAEIDNQWKNDFDDQFSKSKKKKKHKKRERDFEWRESSAELHDESRKRRHHHHRHKKEKRHKRSLTVEDFKMDASMKLLNSRHMSLDESTLRATVESTNLSAADKSNNDFKESTSRRHSITKSYEIDSVYKDESPIEQMDGHTTEMQKHQQRLLDELDKEFVNVRLNCFSRANGALPKGTFLVAKDDVFKEECPLWKIDNQNLLQKYPQIIKSVNGENGARYRNSSTYSGWCDRIADDYLVVEVKFVKQSRAENIIETLVPINDLFPIVVSDLDGNSLSLGRDEDGHCENRKEPDMEAYRDKLAYHFRTFIKAMLNHVVTLNFLQLVSKNKDHNYLEALTEIENRVFEAQKILKSHAKWSQHFEHSLNIYSNFSFCFCDVEYLTVDSCEACNMSEFSATIQFFGTLERSVENVEKSNVEDIDNTTPCPAIEYSICANCENLASLYHRNLHLKQNVYRKCEETLDEFAAEVDSNLTDKIVEKCMQKKSWINNLINEHMEIWRRCEELSTQSCHKLES